MAREQELEQGRGEERESGRPGGGVGRREEVGGSGVYPATEPGAPAGAETRTPAEWGRSGQRAGEEAGRSEPGVERRGGEEAGGAEVDEEDLVDCA